MDALKLLLQISARTFFVNFRCVCVSTFYQAKRNKDKSSAIYFTELKLKFVKSRIQVNLLLHILIVCEKIKLVICLNCETKKYGHFWSSRQIEKKNFNYQLKFLRFIARISIFISNFRVKIDNFQRRRVPNIRIFTLKLSIQGFKCRILAWKFKYLYF